MAQTERSEPYFTERDGALLPAPHARSWWTAGMLHGRLLAGLLARSLEQQHSGEGLHFARLTVDMFRNAPMEPLRVTTERVRDGRRIRVADAVVHASVGPVARAAAVLLRRGEQPTGFVPNIPEWDALPPDQLPDTTKPDFPIQMFDAHNTPIGYWGDSGTLARRIWVHEFSPLVAGESLTPFVRAALAADAASPMTHAGKKLEFINADYTLLLSRLPMSDVVGLESGGHISEDGIAVGHATVYDIAGPIGHCTTTALANQRSVSGPKTAS
ncbi:acyl-CoA thioesterase domain-containing protein [Nocardia sp. alder85J]|uniref:acyl-CoA thioesterase domain-containing protein n=1 Tax=Nocardia sp. alder85J TaxID=2862949 RepID=UPI001CD39819|nr:acyl-CoA thioesterase domain-containing protein [Nocardia sp. alder85J]MCX4095409.1 thioesterase family protein [Nocardia sp. alder85J]